MEEKEVGSRIPIGGDFNARTGREGGTVGEEEKGESGGEKRRRLKDGKINRNGRKLVELVEEKRWSIFNGNMRGDEEGEFTFTVGKGYTVIDYVIGDEDVRGRIKRLRIGDRIESDHHPVEVWVEGKVERKRRRERIEGVGRVIWDEEGREMFREKMTLEKTMGEGLEEAWGDMEVRIKKAMKVTEEEQGKGRIIRRGWWEECKDKKREVREELRKWRREGEEKEGYREKKREYRELCERKKREESERWEKEAEQVKKEKDVWEIVNKGRRKRRRVNENIEEREWKDYFMRLLGGVEHRVVRGNWDRRRKDGEGEISKEEIRGAIRRLKDGKAAGYDRIPGEVWKYGGEDLVDWGWKFCKGCGREKGGRRDGRRG